MGRGQTVREAFSEKAIFKLSLEMCRKVGQAKRVEWIRHSLDDSILIEYIFLPGTVLEYQETLVSKYEKNCYAHEFPVVLSFYCYVTNHPKLRALKWPLILLRICVSGNWEGFCWFVHLDTASLWLLHWQRPDPGPMLAHGREISWACHRPVCKAQVLRLSIPRGLRSSSCCSLFSPSPPPVPLSLPLFLFSIFFSSPPPLPLPSFTSSSFPFSLSLFFKLY